MDAETFIDTVEDFFARCSKLLEQKNRQHLAEKTSNRLSQFYEMASYMKSTPEAEALHGQAKQLVSLRDRILSEEYHDSEFLEELLKDIANYTAIIYCLLKDQGKI